MHVSARFKQIKFRKMLFFITVTVLVASANAKFYTDCGSKLATVQNVSVSGCSEDAKECVLRRNTNVTFTIEFTPTVEVKAIKTEVHGVIMDLPIPFPLPQPNACKDTGLSCPLQANQLVVYSTTMSILKSYPKVKVGVKWELVSEDTNQDLLCVLIPAKLL